MRSLPGAALALALSGIAALAAPSGGAATPAPGAIPAARDSGAGDSPGWALVLSGGGARGLAHIGALRAIEEEGIRPDLVVGTSMGALIGALWASGRTSGEIAAEMDALNWVDLFDPPRLAPAWRRTVSARPWVRLVVGERGLGLPAGLVDDSELDFRLSVDLLDAEAAARGDFDRLPIRFRAVATDAADLKPVILERGSLAHALRASISIPAVLPPVARDTTVLVDGGVASHLPIEVARLCGASRLLAVDVEMPPRRLREDESVLTISLTLLDRVNRRGQEGDTTRPGDARVWIPLPHISPTAWGAADRIVALGYSSARDSIHSWAIASGLPRGAGAPIGGAIRLPPIAGPIRWADRHGQPARRARDADAVFGRLPRGAFAPATLAPGMERVYRAGLFESAWPWFRVSGDSTRIGMEVKEYPPVELRGAFEYDNDTEARGQASLAWRPAGGHLPGDIRAGGTLRKYGQEAFVAVGPHPLERGSSGWFVRTAARETRVRVFGAAELDHPVRVGRLEATAGLQRVLAWGGIVQLGAGGTLVRSEGTRRGGPLVALRAEGTGAWHRVIEGAWRPGRDPYGAGSVDLDHTLRLGHDYGVRASLGLGYASARAPLDEWRGIGGPGEMPGLRSGEWLGRRVVAGELRVTRVMLSTLRLHANVDAGTVGGVIGRPDLGGRVHVGAGAGLSFASALGPLSLDYGVMDRSRFRVDVRIGETF